MTGKIKNYNSNQSRREFLKLMGTSTLGIYSTGLIGCGSGAGKTLKFYGTGTLDIEDWTKLKNDLGIILQFYDNGNDTGPVITQMIAGTASSDYHLGGLQGGAERELATANKIIPWDLEKIPNWDTVWEWAKGAPYTKVNGKQYGLPIVINADSIIYLPDKVKEIIPGSNGVIDSYASVFDERFKGRASMEDAWINSVIFTAIYLKESGIQKIIDPGDLEVEELEAVMEFLIKKKQEGQFLKFWSGWQDGLELVKSKKVFVMTGWEPIVYAAREMGINVEYAVPKEGFEGWSNDLIMHTSVLDEGLIDIAHQFANWELMGYYGCQLAKKRGYVIPNDNSIKFAKENPQFQFDIESQANISENVKNKFLQMKGNIYWQNVRPKNYKLYEKWWSKLRNV